MIEQKRIKRVEITESFARYVSSGKVEFFQQAGIELILGARAGCWMYDLDGRKWLNCHSNGGVFNLGHRHPRIVGALREAVEHLDIGNHHLISESRAALAERLAGTTPGDLNRVVFGVSGGEAVDLAIKVARACTGRPEIISARGGYHGHTGFALAAGDPQYNAPFGPLPPGFMRIPFGDILALEKALSSRTAAVLLEPIPATLGIVVPPEGYLAQLRDLCDKHGALLIADEIQTGLGRCGEPWGVQSFGVVPDILVTGKGLSGGMYPITATIIADHLNEFLHANPFIHISTYGGAELGCQVALTVLDLLEEPGFLRHVREMAAFYQAGLQDLAERHAGTLVGVRQRGLMMGLQLADPSFGPVMSRLCLEHGLFVVYANNDPAVMQFLPPLIIDAEEAHFTLEGLDRALGQLAPIAQGTMKGELHA